MNMGSRSGKGIVRYFSDILLSCNVALAVVTVLVNGNHFLARQYFGWRIGLNVSLHRHYRDILGEYLAFILWGGILTIVIFSIIRLLSRSFVISRAFATAAGIANIVAAPACFWTVRLLQPSEFLGLVRLEWLSLEEAFALVCTLMFRWRRWPISLSTTIVLLTLHTTVWFRAYTQMSFRGSHVLAIPIVTFFSMLLWGMQTTRVAGPVKHSR